MSAYLFDEGPEARRSWFDFTHTAICAERRRDRIWHWFTRLLNGMLLLILLLLASVSIVVMVVLATFRGDDEERVPDQLPISKNATVTSVPTTPTTSVIPTTSPSPAERTKVATRPATTRAPTSWTASRPVTPTGLSTTTPAPTTTTPAGTTVLTTSTTLLATTKTPTTTTPAPAPASGASHNTPEAVDQHAVEPATEASPPNSIAGEQQPEPQTERESAFTTTPWCASGNELVDIRFDLGDGDQSTQDLRLLEPRPGDIVRMSWLPGCGDPNKTVALVVYETRSGRRFDHATDEIRVDHQECVLAECGVIEGRRVLAVEVPALCSYQIDAVNGPVLDIVGPGGSYYKFGQPASRLISAKNMRVIDCDSGNEIGD